MSFNIELRNPGSSFDISLSGSAPQSITTAVPVSSTAFFDATITGGAQAPAARPKIVARRKQLRDKPPAGTRLDLSHPLTQGLACAYFLNERGGDRAFDALGGTLPLTGTDTTWNNRGTVSFNGTTSRFAGDRSVTHELPSNAVTIVVGVMITGNPGTGALYYGKLNDYADASWGIRSQIWNTNTDTQARIKISGTQQTTPNGNCPLTLNVPYILVARWASGDFIDLFVFDRRTNTRVSSVQSSATYSGSISYDTRGVTIGRQIYSDNSETFYVPGEIDFALTSARRWSDAEIQRFISAPFEILSPRPSPLILAADSAGGGAQTITTAAPSAGTTFYNATVTPGAVTITTAAPSASTSFFNATVTPGTVTITTAAPTAGTSFYNATVSPGAVTITTAAPSASTSFYDATVTPGVVTVTTAAPTSGTVIYEATVSNGAATIVTTAPSAATTFYTATVTPGQVNITTAAPSANTTFFNAVVSSGVFFIVTASPTSNTSFFPPRVNQQPITVVILRSGNKTTRKRRKKIIERAPEVDYGPLLQRAAELELGRLLKEIEEKKKKEERERKLIELRRLENQAESLRIAIREDEDRIRQITLLSKALDEINERIIENILITLIEEEARQKQREQLMQEQELLFLIDIAELSDTAGLI
jgi:hypothetical protein